MQLCIVITIGMLAISTAVAQSVFKDSFENKVIELDPRVCKVTTNPCKHNLDNLPAGKALDVSCPVDLQGRTVLLPKNITLNFTGGYIKNGTLRFTSGGKIDGKLLNNSLNIYGTAVLTNSSFNYYPCQWDVQQGKVSRARARANKQQMQRLIPMIKSMGATQMNIGKFDAYFEPSYRKPKPTLLGLHDSPFLIPDNFTLQMSAQTHIRVQPRPVTDPGGVSLMAITDGNQNSIIRGGNLHGDRLEGDFGADGKAYVGVNLISIAGATNPVVENVKLLNASFAAITVMGHQMRLRYDSSVGKWMPNDAYIMSEGAIIRNNVLDTARLNCLSVVDGERIQIINNTFLNCGQDTSASKGLAPKFAIDLEAGERMRDPNTNELIEPQIVRDILVKGNTEKNSNQGFFIASVARGPIIVEENKVERRMSIKLADNVTFRNNVSDARNFAGGSKWVAITLGGRASSDTNHHNQAYGNTIIGFGTGITIGGRVGNKVHNNTIRETGSGLQFESLAKNIEVYDNDIEATNNAVYLFHTNSNKVVENVLLKNNILSVPNGKTAIMVKPFNRDATSSQRQLVFKDNTINGAVITSGALNVEYSKNMINGRFQFNELLGYQPENILLNNNTVKSNSTGVDINTPMRNSTISNNSIEYKTKCIDKRVATAPNLVETNNICTPH